MTKSIWGKPQIRRITYHAAARYYQRFEHRELNEAEIDEGMYWKATRAVQRISTIWTKTGDNRYEFENAVFITDNPGRIVITIYPKRQIKQQRIRRKREYYQSLQD